MDTYRQTPRTQIHRLPQRATYDRNAIHAILDEVLVAHVGFVADDQPYVLPMAFVRLDDSLFLHGSNRSRLLQNMTNGAPVCVTVTALDGLVLARSAFHHSVNYRSVAVLGCGRAVEDAERLNAVFRALVEKFAPGRWTEIREPNTQERKATAVVELPMEEVVAKVRTGPPIDDQEDLGMDAWAGTVALTTRALAPEPSPDLATTIPLPEHVRALLSRWS